MFELEQYKRKKKTQNKQDGRTCFVKQYSQFSFLLEPFSLYV